MAERDYVELARQYALGNAIQRQHFSNTWYDLTQDDFDEHGNIIFDDRDSYRIKPGFEFNTELADIASNVMFGLRVAGFSNRNICASIQNGIIRIEDKKGNIWRITITKE